MRKVSEIGVSAVGQSEQVTGAEVRREVDVPLRGGTGRFITFRGLCDPREHLAIGFGAWRSQAVPLVRIHSECLTGDVFGSAKCDCGEQLNESISLMLKRGGILLYLRQEGRDIGLYNKLDAYALQQQGMDTYEANEALGFPRDLRDYQVAAEMLRALGKSRIELFSNNPEKRSRLEEHGIDVALSARTGVFLKRENRAYLAAKVRKTGHALDLTGSH